MVRQINTGTFKGSFRVTARKFGRKPAKEILVMLVVWVVHKFPDNSSELKVKQIEQAH